ncbi:uncharacterized protein V1516DRAFT_675105 [Lipomyces oligophaga]|uniref:uncharacterized protein n=1 Tax=Lipomyces oligophaga TaxID=45792 RepID=UPI0034CF0FA9
MPKVCTHKGCGKQFEKPDESECWYHSGPPIFHDAMKGWSCCKKRVISFDDFLAIPGCTSGFHTTEVPEPIQPAEPSKAAIPSMVDENGVETYGGSDTIIDPNSKKQSARAEPPKANVPTQESIDAVQKKLDNVVMEDPDDIDIPIGAKCKRNGCTVKFDGTNRDSCVYHPGSAVFHDASKGWSCCKRRVLEFDEFLKIAGCTTGKHLYVGALEPEKPAGEEEVECKTDFYQTPSTVIVSVFAKKCEADKSSIEFKADSVSLNLFHLGNKRFKTTFQLYGPIDPEKSKYKIMGTKVELSLVKANGLSWSGLRAGESGAGMIRFGVSGRTGTIGGKEIVYRNQS